VTLIVFVPADGVPDITARLIGQSLSQRIGQAVVIDNRPGAGGNIGSEAVVRAPADGYTLLLVGGFNAINATLYDKLSFNFIPACARAVNRSSNNPDALPMPSVDMARRL
jgi:tripartite-type tricarboxylate transporter receptor subunit TctC